MRNLLAIYRIDNEKRRGRGNSQHAAPPFSLNSGHKSFANIIKMIKMQFNLEYLYDNP